MKDIVITPKRLRNELLVLLACFVVAFLVNVYAVVRYSTPAIEIVSQIGYVCILTGVLYVLQWAIRIVIWLISLIVKRLKK